MRDACTKLETVVTIKRIELYYVMAYITGTPLLYNEAKFYVSLLMNWLREKR